MSCKRISVDVTFPNTGKTRSFRSIRSVARMLSGNGTASGGLRTNISYKAFQGLMGSTNNVVRHNRVYG